MPRVANLRRSRAATAGRDDGIYTGRVFTALEVVSREPPSGVTWPGPALVDELRPIVARWVVAGRAGRNHVLLPVGIWAGAHISASQPLPCHCRVGETTGRCRDFDNHETIVRRGWRSCDCWGRPLHESTPPGCCSRHEGSQRLAAWRPGDVSPDVDPAAVDQVEPEAGHGTAYLRREAETGDLIEANETFSRLDELALEADLVEEAEAEGWMIVTTAARGRLLGCQCTSASCSSYPVTGDRKTSIYHCPDCHRNFSSYGLASMHSRTWMSPCKDPLTIRDIRTGHELLVLRGDVWCKGDLTEPGKPGFKYE